MNKLAEQLERWQDRRVADAMNAGCGRRDAARKAKARRKDIAEAIGISEVTLFNWANGRTNPNLDGIMRLAAFLGVSVNDLIDDG